MSAVEAFQPHMLLSAVVNTIFYKFSFNFWPFAPAKSRFSIETVVIFEVCAIFASDALCDVSWGPFRTVGGSPGTLLAGSLGLFGVSCGPLGGLFRRALRSLGGFLRRLGPQDAPERSPRGLRSGPPSPPEAAWRHQKGVPIFKIKVFTALRRGGGR